MHMLKIPANNIIEQQYVSDQAMQAGNRKHTQETTSSQHSIRPILEVEEPGCFTVAVEFFNISFQK